MNNKNNLDLIGVEEGYHVFKNSEGFLEGYKKVGKNKNAEDGTRSDVHRVVSNQKTIEGFGKYVRGLKRKRTLKDIPVKIKDLPQLFDGEF